MSDALPTPASILIVNAYHRDTTGADRYCRDLAALLEGAGHRVAPFAARHAENDEAGEWQRFFPRGAQTGASERPGWLRRLRDLGTLLYGLEARRQAGAVMRAFRPDLVHAHNLFHHLSPSVLHPFRAAGIPVVMTLHDYKLVCPNYTLYTQGHVCTACQGGRFWPAVERRCVRDSRLLSAVCAGENTLHWSLGLYERGVDLWIAPSRFLVDRFVEFGYPVERFRVVPNFTPAPASSDVPEGDSVLFAGRLVETKGPSLLLRAWARTRTARRTLRLVFAGDGPMRAALEREAGAHEIGRIEFRGLLDRGALGDLMARAVAVVVPSLWYEVFGLVAAEAMARERPVIAARIGGLPEVVEDERTGILVSPGEVDELAQAIDRLAESPELRRRLGREGGRRAREILSPERHYRSLRAVYAEASEGRRR